jgi:phosphoenolpyruvate synthase/pyruvate phosphate dikinase
VKKSYAHFLVEQGIDSISFDPDAMVKDIETLTGLRPN